MTLEQKLSQVAKKVEQRDSRVNDLLMQWDKDGALSYQDEQELKRHAEQSARVRVLIEKRNKPIPAPAWPTTPGSTVKQSWWAWFMDHWRMPVFAVATACLVAVAAYKYLMPPEPTAPTILSARYEIHTDAGDYALRSAQTPEAPQQNERVIYPDSPVTVKITPENGTHDTPDIHGYLVQQQTVVAKLPTFQPLGDSGTMAVKFAPNTLDPQIAPGEYRVVVVITQPGNTNTPDPAKVALGRATEGSGWQRLENPLHIRPVDTDDSP